MKIAFLIFMMIGSATLTPRIGYAVPPDQGAQQASSDGAESAVSGHSHDTERAPGDGGRNGRHGSAKNPALGKASPEKANRLNQLHSNRERATSPNAVNLHPLSSNQSTGAARAAFMQNGRANNAMLSRSLSPNRPAVSSLSNVRHRTPNPAAIGGSANSYSRNTGAINGTSMRRKP